MTYAPKEPSGITTVDQLLSYVTDEFYAIAQELSSVDILRFKVRNVAPERPREGMVAVADGTNWNPGSGAGIYLYIGAAWTKL